jgi:chemotaxis response regulator CheB
LFAHLKDQLQTIIESQYHHIVSDEERDPQEDNDQKVTKTCPDLTSTGQSIPNRDNLYWGLLHLNPQLH